MPRETKQEKSVRLLLEDRVRIGTLTRDLVGAKVRGDTDDYRVWRDERGKWNCDCVYGRHDCSHILAVEKVWRAVRNAKGCDG